MLSIVADVHERASGVPEFLKALGVEVESRRLTRGDYVVGPETIVERKTVGDLHATIEAGRFWSQMRKVRAAGRWPYLLIEGPSLYRGCVPASSVRGLCLAVVDLGITIIHTDDPRDTAHWLSGLAIRRKDGAIRDRPVYAQRPQSSGVAPAEAALTCAPGVSTETVRESLRSYTSPGTPSTPTSHSA